MSLVLSLSHQTGVRLAEIGSLFILIAGVWLAAGQVPQLKLQKTRTIVAGVLLAIAGLLFIIAFHFGKIG